MTKVEISVVFSFRNEEKVLPELIRRLSESLGPLRISYELIFVNDFSTDQSLSILEKTAKADSRIKCMTTEKRLGVIPCFIEGFRRAKGSAVIMMDSDLQDPPELLPEMIEKWKEGAEVVYTVRTHRRGESSFKMAATKLAYKILSRISPVEFPVDAGDFRLLSRKAIDAILKNRDEHVYLRGFVPSLGLKQASVSYERLERFQGQTHFPLYSLDPSGPVATFFTALLNFASKKNLFLFFFGVFFSFGFLTAVVTLFGMKVIGLSLKGSEYLFYFVFAWSASQALGVLILQRWIRLKRKSPGRLFDRIQDTMDLFDPQAFQSAVASLHER